ncbi:MAG: hypothetical protein ACYC4U_11495 [Pirellulaceae bacterium]
MSMPQLMPLLAATRILALEAQLRVREGDTHGAVSSLETLFAAARSLESYPHGVGHWVCIAMYVQGFDTLRQLMTEFSDIELQQMERELEKCHLGDSLCEVMLGERVIGLLELEDPQRFLEFLTTDEAEEARRITRKQADEFVRMVPFVQQRDIWLYLLHMEKLIEASQKPLPDRLKMVESLTREWGTLTLLNHLTKSGGQSIYEMAAADVVFLAYLIVPGHDVTFLVNARTIAQQRLMATAVEVERFRRKTGEVPDTLRELTPGYLRAIPLDPFDGREVRYVRRGDGYRIYSVGSNRSDEGGAGAFSGNYEDIVVDVPTRTTSRTAAEERHGSRPVE